MGVRIAIGFEVTLIVRVKYNVWFGGEVKKLVSVDIDCEAVTVGMCVSRNPPNSFLL